MSILPFYRIGDSECFETVSLAKWGKNRITGYKVCKIEGTAFTVVESNLQHVSRHIFCVRYFQKHRVHMAIILDSFNYHFRDKDFIHYYHISLDMENNVQLFVTSAQLLCMRMVMADRVITAFGNNASQIA